MAEKKQSIKQRLEEEAAGGGIVSVGSRDFADMTPREPVKEVHGDVEVPVPELPRNADPVADMAKGPDAAEAIQVDGDKAQQPGNPLSVPEDTTLPERVTLTEDDRNAFIDALIKGDRYVRPFSCFGGAVTGKFRSRLQKESAAIMGVLLKEYREGQLGTTVEYSTRVRNILLTAQVAALQDEEHRPLSQPLNWQVMDDGKQSKPPGWITQVDLWSEKPEALVSALYQELRLFEQKYWTMVLNAQDQDFWQAEGPISR
jgi:hypothetical protein